jgi:tight adherence protein B
MTGIFELVLLLLALGVAVFAFGELWREAHRRRAERALLDRVGADDTGGAPGDSTGGGEDTRARAERTPGHLTSLLRRAGLAVPAAIFVGAVALVAVAVGLLVYGLLPQVPLAGVLAGLLVLVFPFSLLDSIAQRRARRFLDKLVDAVDVMCAALDGGEPPANALATAASAAEEPARRELREAHHRLQVGQSVRRSFAPMVERYDSEGVRLITQTLIVKWQAGGDLAPVLRNVNQIARDLLRHEREVRSQLSGAQASAILTALLPYLLLPFFLWQRPEWFRELTTNPLGLKLLTVAILLQFVGFLWLRRLMRVVR